MAEDRFERDQIERDRFESIEPLLARAGVQVTPAQADELRRFGALLNKWNQRIHLTGQRHRLFSHHLLDCAMVALPPLAANATRAVDIGSGAGLPGVVLAILRPELEVDTLDTSAKKVAFVQVVAGELKLRNLVPRRENVRQWMTGEGKHGYDIAVSRAFARVDALLPLGRDLLKGGGELWCFKGQRLHEEQALLGPEHLEGFDETPTVYFYDFPETGTGGAIAAYKRNEDGKTG